MWFFVLVFLLKIKYKINTKQGILVFMYSDLPTGLSEDFNENAMLSLLAPLWGSLNSIGLRNFSPCGPHMTRGLNSVSPMYRLLLLKRKRRNRNRKNYIERTNRLVNSNYFYNSIYIFFHILATSLKEEFRQLFLERSKFSSIKL